MRTRTLPRCRRIAGHEREVLEAEIGGGGVLGIGTSPFIERLEIDPLAAHGQRATRAAASQPEKRHLRRSHWSWRPGRKSDGLVELRQPVRHRCRQAKRQDCREPPAQGRTQPRTLV